MVGKWKKRIRCHPEPFAVILSAAKDLFHLTQGKFREGSLHFQVLLA